MSAREDSALADLATHEHTSDLEAALDYAMAAHARAASDGIDVDPIALARIKLGLCGTREAFYADTRDMRRLCICEAMTHLEAALNDLETDRISHPTRHALQFLKWVQDGDAE